MSADPGLLPPPPGADRRAERRAAAEELLTAPPPLQDLRTGRVRVLEGAVVHASRHRPVVRWTVAVDTGTGPGAPLAVIGKAYRRGGGEEAWRLLQHLRRAGFDSPGLQVPAPYGFDADRQLLAQEEAPPTTLHDLLDDVVARPRTAAAAARRVGAWLAHLHAVDGVPVPPLGDGFEGARLAEYGDALAALLPAEAARLSGLVAATLTALSRPCPAAVVTHGDFQPKNIHLDARRVVVIDFDRAARAPAARDLGHFVGQTLTMAAARHGALDAADGVVDAFLAGYRAGGGDPRAVAAAPAYVARTFAEVLFYRLVVRPSGSSSFVPAWLDAWERALDPARAALP